MTKPSLLSDDPAATLAAIRKEMKAAKVDAYIVPSEDPHMSEYPPDCCNRRVFVSGFTGSAGAAVVLENKALLWTDGRYSSLSFAVGSMPPQVAVLVFWPAAPQAGLASSRVHCTIALHIDQSSSKPVHQRAKSSTVVVPAQCCSKVMCSHHRMSQSCMFRTKTQLLTSLAWVSRTELVKDSSLPSEHCYCSTLHTLV